MEGVMVVVAVFAAIAAAAAVMDWLGRLTHVEAKRQTNEPGRRD